MKNYKRAVAESEYGCLNFRYRGDVEIATVSWSQSREQQLNLISQYSLLDILKAKLKQFINNLSIIKE